jgi:AbrB family looped-hinge helix DNA binding protein
MTDEVTISSKGQVTIPKAIRDRLRLKPGDRVAFRVRGDEVVVEPARRLMDWYGAFRPDGVAEDAAEVRKRVRREMGRRTAAEGLDGPAR